MKKQPIKICTFIIIVLIAQPCFSDGSISINKDSVYINQQSVRTSTLLESLADKSAITFVFDQYTLKDTISINKKFTSLEAAINHILRRYNKVMTYDDKGNLSRVKVLNEKKFAKDNSQQSDSTRNLQTNYIQPQNNQTLGRTNVVGTDTLPQSSGIWIADEDPEEVISVDEDPEEIISVEEDPEDIISVEEEPEEISFEEID